MYIKANKVCYDVKVHTGYECSMNALKMHQ